MALGKNNQVVHRVGPLKQSNKPHKGGRSNDKKSKGKVDVKVLTKGKKHDLNRKERKNRVQQLRKVNRDEILMQKRGFGSINNSPVVVVILSLDDSIDTEKFFTDLQYCDDEIVVTSTKFGSCHLSFPRQKQRFTFILPSYNSLYSVMDSLKVADVLILLHPLIPLNEYAEKLLSIIISYASPTTIHVIQGLDKMNPKKRAECRKTVAKNAHARFPDIKLHSADTRQELQLLLRQIGCQKQKSVTFRDSRFHLLAENVEYVKPETDIGNGILKVSGYVCGQPINVNGLIHIPGWGNFQLSQIDYVTDPFPGPNKVVKHKSASENGEDMSLDHVVLCDKANPVEQESLQSEIVPDSMEGEQTWPTKEELEEANLKPKRTVKKVVEGTSEYQAAWIVESEDSELSDDEESDSEDSADIESAKVSEEDCSMDQDVDDLESILDIKDDNYDKNMDMDEDKKMHVRFKEERMNEMFPDELDTPIDLPARTRFQKYRGLKNFKSSPWDPMENLPHDYAKIYRFENFKLTKKKVFSSEKSGAMPGLYVTLHIKDVPQSVYFSTEESLPFVVYGLLPHEQKMSVMNVVIRKHPSCKSSVKSKDNLIFHIGYKRFTCAPIFSEYKTGNKFKYERFLPRESAVVASFYAPTIFPPASVVIFKQLTDGTHELVATGSVLDVNPNRVIVKRIVLSGHPFKIFKRMATVRYMFFTKEDIDWFKCVELHTKCGRKGHIRESLGSHGHMKCIFDKQLQSQDVVLMSLYKRVFPKWTFNSYVPTPTNESEYKKLSCESMI